MKKMLFVAVIVVLISSTAIAQDFPKAEVFGGYSLAKVSGDAGDIIDLVGNELSPLGSASTWLKMGFMGSVTFNINEYFGIEGNFSYHRDDVAELNASFDGESINAKVKGDSFNFMAGPHVAYRENEMIAPFGHFLLGVNSVKLCGECTGSLCEDLPEELEVVDMTDRDASLAFAFGGGLDLNVSESFAIRAIEFDYILSNHGEGGYDFSVNYVTLSFGAVFKIGD